MSRSRPVLLDEHLGGQGLAAGLAEVIRALAGAGKLISRDVGRGALAGILGTAGRTNVQGEEVQKLDVIAHETIVAALADTGLVAVMGSEEEPGPITVPGSKVPGPFAVVFDPLDGSSNIDSAVPVGTIFGVFPRRSSSGGLEDLLQPGSCLAAAGYLLYGSSTLLVCTAGEGADGFTLDPALGEFALSHPGIRIPESGGTLSLNGGNRAYWTPAVKRFVEHLEAPGEGRPYTHRYVGSLVADFHRNLLHGGIFLYPADTRDPRRPRGKLRLLYEAAPLARLCEQAGGAASTGRERIVDLVPDDLHQRVPLIVGSRRDVELAVSFHRDA